MEGSLTLGTLLVAAAAAQVEDPAELDRSSICRRLRVGNAASWPPPHTVRQLFWLHPPKTGTSFGNTVLRYACPKVPRGARMNETWPPHTPENGGMKMLALLKEFPPSRYCASDALRGPTDKERKMLRKTYPDLDSEDAKLKMARNAIAGHYPLQFPHVPSSSGVAMFRSAHGRIVSAFNHFKNSPGLLNIHQDARKNATTVDEFIQVPGVAGCQVSMMLGDSCSVPTKITVDKLATAIARMKDFVFVGITEFWNLSICLFHAQLGGTTDAADLVNTRPTAKQNHSQSHSGSNTVQNITLVDAELRDPADVVLFETALRIFRKRLIKYGFALPSTMSAHTHDLSSLCASYGHKFYCDPTIENAVRGTVDAAL